MILQSSFQAISDPKWPAPPPSAVNERGADRGHKPSIAPTVLVVEDEELFREVLCEYLRQRGYVVLEARHAAEALRVSSEHPGTIDLMVSDVMMPGMSGLDLARTLAVERSKMCVLLMSGCPTEETLLYSRTTPGTTFLHKPFMFELLERRMRDVMRNR